MAFSRWLGVHFNFARTLVAACGLALSGCATELNPTELTSPSEALRVVAGETVVAGDSSIALRAGEARTFEIHVPGGQALELIARARGANVALLSGVAPDGATLSAAAETRSESEGGRLRVEPLGTRRGLRFVGTSPVDGVWQITLDAVPITALEATVQRSRTRSVLENLALLFYLFSGQPSGSPLEGLLRFGFPDVDALRSVALAVEVNIVAPDDVRDEVPVEPPADDSDGGSGGGSDGGSGGSDGGAGGGSGGAGDGGSGGGDGGSGGGGTPPTPTPTPTPTPSPTPTPTPLPPPSNVTLNAIVRSGDAVPDMPGATFAAFGNPIIDADGRIAFWARYSGGAGDGGLFVWENNALRRVIDDNPQRTGVVPGRGASERFGDFNVRWDTGSLPMVWGNNGRLVFVARSSSGNSLPNGLYRWRASDGEIIRVADDQMMQAVFPNFGRSMLLEMFQPGLTDAGTVVFAARYTYFTASNDLVFRQTGVFSSNASSITPIAASNASQPGSVPDNLPTATFTGAGLTPIASAAGELLLQAQWSAGFGQSGVFLRRAGQTLRVIDNRPNASFPGLPIGAQVGETGAPFEAIALGADSRIAVDTRLTSGMTTRDVVLYWNGERWSELRTTGLANANVLLSGINNSGQTLVLADNRPHLGDATRLTDLAASPPGELGGVAWDNYGAALNNNGRALLRYRRSDASNTPGVALWTGERLLVVADATLGLPSAELNQVFALSRAVIQAPDRPGTLNSTAETDRPGRSGALNDLDQFALRLGALGADGRADTADDVQAIYVGVAR